MPSDAQQLAFALADAVATTAREAMGCPSEAFSAERVRRLIGGRDGDDAESITFLKTSLPRLIRESRQFPAVAQTSVPFMIDVAMQPWDAPGYNRAALRALLADPRKCDSLLHERGPVAVAASAYVSACCLHYLQDIDFFGSVSEVGIAYTACSFFVGANPESSECDRFSLMLMGGVGQGSRRSSPLSAQSALRLLACPRRLIDARTGIIGDAMQAARIDTTNTSTGGCGVTEVCEFLARTYTSRDMDYFATEVTVAVVKALCVYGFARVLEMNPWLSTFTAMRERWQSMLEDKRRAATNKTWQRGWRYSVNRTRIYEQLRHYAAVDRYVLRRRLKLALGPLSHVNHDVMDTILSFVYGDFSIPKRFFRRTFRWPWPGPAPSSAEASPPSSQT